MLQIAAPQRKPWIKPDAATIAKVTEVVDRCPTGALPCGLNPCQAIIHLPRSHENARIPQEHRTTPL